ncbi:protocatechuate 3,4-dioxygenase subunit beta, partial [Streptomyces hainanensis]
PRDYRPYRSSAFRHPVRPLVAVEGGDPEMAELHGPVFGRTDVTDLDNDLTRQHAGEPLGERITVSGRLLDGTGHPVRGQLIELWQANASGRYAHQRDQHPAPLDPHFTGVGRTLTDDEGRYRFTTVRPGAYPWRNHDNAWRPAHLHFSVFGTAFTQRLVTQMYFPGDPLFRHDPILRSVTDESARQRLVAAYDHELSRPEWSLGYRWDIVLDGPAATWIEEGR